jgi:Dolichyl-phosphate-mannose-protein mannosyltransferase
MPVKRGRPRSEKRAPPALLRALTSIGFIVAVALLLRLAFAWQYSTRYSHHALGILPFLFESGNIAYSIATGHGFASPFRVPTGPTAWTTPVYPFLLAGIFRLFGTYTFNAFVVAVGLNILLVSLACVPLYYAARKVGGIKVAAGAAWLWAIFPNAILIPVESLWEASLSALLVAMILWATLRLAELSSTVAWSLYGFLWGFTLMTNPSIAAVLPFLIGWLLWRKRGQIEWFRPAIAVSIMVLCCVPWTIRNYRVFHAFVPLRSVAGLPLWLGNNEHAQARWSGQFHPIVDSGERARYISLGEIAYMREKRDLAIGYMLENPDRQFQLMSRRFLAFWCGGTPYPWQDFVENNSVQFRYVLLFNVAVALGALAATIFLIREKSPYWLPLAAFPAIFPVTYYLTMVVPRYKLPIDPVLMLLTAVAVSRLTFKRAKDGAPGKEVADVRR